ncbi:FHA domain-containing protein [Kitasatospora sp. NPDC056181]|uniref:FHA domain-containing protein n=1 Tax=Kitasatospora sp. NPDC056181 TaxID=3345737 RepID=UPI0035D7A52A
MSPPSQQQALPRLVVDNPGRLRGQVFVLADQPMLVGRDSECQIHVGEPGVSRRHAVVWRSGGHTTVEDLASTNGTRLNGHPVFGQQEVHTGDVLDFGPFEVHYEEPRDSGATVPGLGATGPTASFRTVAPPPPGTPSPPWEPPRPPPQQSARQSAQQSAQESAQRAAAAQQAAAQQAAQQAAAQQAAQQAAAQQAAGRRSAQPPPRAQPPPGSGPRFDVGQQEAENVNNVARDQYNYVMQERRDSFFREIAATRTRARNLILTGFLAFVVGGGVYGWALVSFIVRTNNAAQSGNPDFTVPDLLGPKVGGVPVGAIGFAVAAIGVVLLVVGIVLHIVTTSRRRRFEEDESRRLSMPPPPR